MLTYFEFIIGVVNSRGKMLRKRMIQADLLFRKTSSKLPDNRKLFTN